MKKFMMMVMMVVMMVAGTVNTVFGATLTDVKNINYEDTTNNYKNKLIEELCEEEGYEYIKLDDGVYGIIVTDDEQSNIVVYSVIYINDNFNAVIYTYDLESYLNVIANYTFGTMIANASTTDYIDL